MFQRIKQAGTTFNQRGVGVAFGWSDRRDANGFQIVESPLRFNVEPTDGFNFVAEEFNPQRIRFGGREDINDAALDPDFARQFYRRHPIKPTSDEPIE